MSSTRSPSRSEHPRRRARGDVTATPELQVMVVTDNPALRQELEFGFSHDVGVAHAVEARDAWRWLGDHLPSAVIVDLQTGSAGGYGLARDMQMSSRLGNIPIVVLLDRYQDEWLARQSGAGAIFVKPVEPDAVLAAIRTLLAEPGA